LATIVGRLVPTVRIQPGPTQGFQPNALGASASFSSGGSYGSSPSGGGSSGGGAATGGQASAPAGGGASGGSSSPSRMPAFLVLTGAPADIARAKEVLAAIDVKVPQIKFSARVVELSSDDADRF